MRPIGIGESVRRIIGKAIPITTTDDIASPLQVCAVHTMQQVYESPETEAVILIDVSNMFSSLNREAALRNIQQLCAYQEDPQLFVDGSTLYSKEGIDPLAMALYAIQITPLIHLLEDHGIKQAWYADDSAVGGSFKALREW